MSTEESADQEGRSSLQTLFGTSPLTEKRLRAENPRKSHKIGSSCQSRVSAGLTVRANYSWAKALDYQSAYWGIANSSSTLLDAQNPRLDYGRASHDITNRLILSETYELPFGQGKRLLAHLSGPAEKLVSGWQLNTIISVQDGFPFSPQLGFNRSRDLNTGVPDRPSTNPNFSGPRILGEVERWYNPEAFILPPAGTYGNAARNSLTTPGLAEVDLSLFKNTKISEKVNVEFRAEAFNLFNRANFWLPNFTVLNPDGSARPAAGRITNTATTSRQIQFALKLIW